MYGKSFIKKINGLLSEISIEMNPLKVLEKHGIRVKKVEVIDNKKIYLYMADKNIEELNRKTCAPIYNVVYRNRRVMYSRVLVYYQPLFSDCTEVCICKRRVNIVDYMDKYGGSLVELYKHD